FQLVQAPEVEDHRRRDAEIDEVGEAVELGAEPRRALEQPCDASVDAVEHRGEHDRRDRPFELALRGEADRGQPRAQGWQRDDVRYQRAYRDGPEPAATAGQRIGFERRKWHELNIAPRPPGRHADLSI